MISAFIDLYSDTKSKPTDAMRRYMMWAEVGDEQKDEDPTVRSLCERVADLLGKEAAVLMPSGTMCNEISLAVHCRPGDEVICDHSAHIVNSEAGGPGALAGVMVRTVFGDKGIFTAADVRNAIRPESRYIQRTRLICVEQTSNFGGGTVWPLSTITDVAAVAREARIPMHLDGARLLNAVVASGIPSRSYAEPFDTAWLDLTKGLGCPVGAVLAGSRAFIHEAWRLKQRWGGAMRQSGILAAAGVFALDHHVERLAEDHEHARRLQRGLSQIPGVAVASETVETNIVFFDVANTGRTAADLVSAAKRKGVGLGAFGPTKMRAVTHIGVSRADVDVALRVLEEVLRETAAA